MKAALPWAALALCACAAPGRPQAGPGTARVGAPDLAVSQGALAAALPSPTPAAAQALRLPDRIVLPAAYRLVLLDGHMTLVRDTDPRAAEPGSPALRVVAGDPGSGALAYQPALLPQELAAAVASSRESAARMDNALEAVMRRSRELSAQALELEAQGRRLAQLLSESEARVRQLEGRGAAGAPRGAPDGAPPQ